MKEEKWNRGQTVVVCTANYNQNAQNEEQSQIKGFSEYVYVH